MWRKSDLAYYAIKGNAFVFEQHVPSGEITFTFEGYRSLIQVYSMTELRVKYSRIYCLWTETDGCFDNALTLKRLVFRQVDELISLRCLHDRIYFAWAGAAVVAFMRTSHVWLTDQATAWNINGLRNCFAWDRSQTHLAYDCDTAANINGMVCVSTAVESDVCCWFVVVVAVVATAITPANTERSISVECTPTWLRNVRELP